MVELKAITEENFIDAFNLKLGPGQERFVSHPILGREAAESRFQAVFRDTIWLTSPRNGSIIHAVGAI